MSQVTTHILDTALGRPAQGVRISLQGKQANDQWNPISEGTTDKDGRVNNLLGSKTKLTPGQYRLIFHTANYYQRLNIQCFYPEVNITFEIFDKSHYHVPLLINPFGYSTYRGS